LDWFGEWSSQVLFQVGKKFTESLSLSLPNYSPPIVLPECLINIAPSVHLTYREIILCCIVYIHRTVQLITDLEKPLLPDHIPWVALHEVIGKTICGGIIYS